MRRALVAAAILTVAPAVHGPAAAAGNSGKNAGKPSLVAAPRRQDATATDAPATFAPWVETRAVGEVVVNGEVVIRLRASQGGLSPDQRAEIAADRLRSAIASGLKPSDVVADVKTDKANPRLKALGQVVATASADEVRYGGATPGGLVGSWASSLKRALALPGLTVSNSGVIVPLGETRRVRIGGAARGDIFIGAASGMDVVAESAPPPTPPVGPVPAAPQPADRRVVAAELGGDASELVLRGVNVGRETITLNRGGATVTISIAVQPYAGRFADPSPVTLTGSIASPTLVARLAAASALGAATPLPGANARLGVNSINAPLPPAGESRVLNIPVSITGPEMLTVSRTVPVTVSTRTLRPVETDVLLYSNNPERLTGYGTLFVGRMSQAQGATRVLFHHQSFLPQNILFTVELINDKDAPTEVQVVGGSAGPVRDTVWVGYRATSDFMRDYLADSGAIHTVPPRSRLGLVVTKLAPDLTISGLMQLRVISGDAPLVRVAADVPGGPTSLPTELLPYPMNFGANGVPTAAFNLSEHVYPSPTKKSVETFTVGGPWLFLPLGRVPITAAALPERRLDGNYGVIYDYTVNLENPTEKETKVFVSFEPSAGMAGGVFLIDGKSVEIPQTSPPQEPTLATYILPPGSKRAITIKSLPLSGSNYPARIIVRP